MSTRIVVRPRQNFTDSLISSIGSIYLTMISFFLIYSYVSINFHLDRQTTPTLFAFDKLLVLRDIARGAPLAIRDARTKDIPQILQSAQTDQHIEIGKRKEEAELGATEATPSKFTDELLQRSKIFSKVPMRMTVDETCDVLVSTLAPGQNFKIRKPFGTYYDVKSEDVQLAVFRPCDPGIAFDEFKALIFRLDEGKFAFSMPRVSAEQIPHDRPYDAFKELDRVPILLPQPIQKYVKFRGEYVVLDETTFNSLARDFAEAHLRKHFPANKLDDAVQELYGLKKSDASYFGITTPDILLVRYGPLIYFVLSFELWRRVRRLPAGRIFSEQYWFAFETRDLVGRTYSFFYACAPIILGVLIYALFVFSQGLGLRLFGRWITIEGLITLNFPRIFLFWPHLDYFAVTVAVLLVPVQFLILLLIVRKLVAVIYANVR